jgi:hypothetical protein
MNSKSNYRITAITIFIHIFILSVCFNMLVGVFEFPEILRATAEYRLTLFMENSHIVVPLYYFLALTGFTQIILSIMLHQSFDDQKSSLVLMTTTFGVLTGIFQVLGFIRWPIVVPYFAEAMNNNVSMETIAFVEGMLNRYAGMAVGEHLGFFAQAAWTTMLGYVMLQHKLFDRSLGWTGVLIGLFTFPMSLEPLGGAFTIFGELTWPVNGALYIWLVIVGISLLRTNVETREGMKVGWKTATVSTLIWALLVVPSFF